MSFVQFVTDADIGSLVCLIVILSFVGDKMAGPVTRQWGKTAGCAAFLAHCLVVGYTQGPATAREWVGVTWRALFSCALVTSLAWIVISVIVFVVQFAPRPRRRPAPIQLTKAGRSSGEQREVPEKQVVYVRVPPTREQKMKDLAGELEQALKLLDGLPEDERPIAEDQLRMKYLKRVEEMMK